MVYMKIDNNVLRKRLDTKLIKLVKPDNMSVDEYKIACNLEGFDASVENGSFLHWLVTSPAIVEMKVRAAILNALKKKYLLDESNIEQMSYFCDAVRDVVIKDHEWTTSLLEAVLKNYKGTEVYNFCSRLNKAVGFTSIGYFTGIA